MTRMISSVTLFAALAWAGCSGGDDTSDSGGDSGAADSGDSGAADSGGDTGAGDSGGDSGTTDQCQTDICATYGAAVPQVASDIVDAAATDPEFADDFAPLVAQGSEAVDAFKTSLANFISDAYGCSTGAYTGPSMVKAHTGLDITQQEYDDFIGLVAGVLLADGVPKDDVTQCFAPPLVDPGFSSTIVGH